VSESSRTAKSIKNAKVALIFYFINLVLQFFSRKVFLDYLGAEVLGLNTTAQNLIGFLNLAELGIGGAIAFTLYKPIYEKNTQVINEIVSVQGWLYRRVAYVVIAGACILMCFFPLIFEKAKVPMWYTYGSFTVLLISTLLGYFVNYRQIVLTADQKEYKITLNTQGFKIIKVLLQIAAICCLSNGYVYWLVLELMMSFTTAVALDRLLKKEYPWLKPTPSIGRKIKRKYPEIITKTKQVFYHQVAGVVLQQTSPMVIYAYTSLTLVAIYGNYMLIIVGVTLLLNAYVLEQPAFILLLIIAFINLTRINDVFLAAYGLYQDTWAPITEAVLNLGLSILLGYYWGIIGVLWGILISLLIIVCGWKPFFLYKYGFKESIREYLIYYLKYIFLIVVSCICVTYILNFFPILSSTSYGKWLFHCFVLISTYSVFSLILFICFDRFSRFYLYRIVSLLKK